MCRLFAGVLIGFWHRPGLPVPAPTVRAVNRLQPPPELVADGACQRAASCALRGRLRQPRAANARGQAPDRAGLIVPGARARFHKSDAATCLTDTSMTTEAEEPP